MAKRRMDTKVLGIVGAQLEQITPLSGTSDPTTSTVGAVKQLYVNTTTGSVFVCRAIADDVYTWQGVGGAASGSLALIETITLTQNVNSVSFANIGDNIYDEIVIDYAGTASASTITVNIRNAGGPFCTFTVPSATSTRFVRMRIIRLEDGASGMYILCGNSSNRAIATNEQGVLTGPNANGISEISVSLDSAYTFQTGGVFKVWARKWAM